LDFGVAIRSGHDLLNMVLIVGRKSATRRQQKNQPDRQGIGELQILLPVSQGLGLLLFHIRDTYQGPAGGIPFG
jgi:hypothetical protein